MKIDVNYKFKLLNGKDLKELVIDEEKDGNPKRDKEGTPLLKLGSAMTLRKICEEVLVNPPMDIDPMTKRPKEIEAAKKIDMWNLAQEIHASNGLVDLKSDQQEMLKKLINKRYPSGMNASLIVAQAYATLDPTAEEEKKKIEEKKK
ncbi:MAG: hypothetical protein KAT69_03185 [Candidatus Aminicenantes bacterium]|nr:hypothetical protein [Candidatus Aminicenantes bacterium]